MAASSNNTEHHHGHDVVPSFSIARTKVLILPFSISHRTAFSLVKSRLAIGSPGCSVVIVRHHAENGSIHRKIAVDWALMIKSNREFAILRIVPLDYFNIT